METKKHILGISFKGLQNGLEKHGLKKFRAKQIWEWIYSKGIINPEEMTNLGPKDVAKLNDVIDFSPLKVSQEQVSKDGTVKWLFSLHDGHDIEAVFIPEGTRGTLCVSSQVGCTLNCRFCHTGTQGLSRNVDAHEIVAQVWMAKDRLLNHVYKEYPEVVPKYLKKNGGEGRVVTNIVFMGMGEPLYNWENVRDANKILMDERGFAFGSRKITISTSGMVPNIAKIANDLGVNLAISIHAPDTETRQKIMPITNKWNVEELMSALRAFPLKEHRRITWEYVMLDGVNDSVQQAKDLLNLIEGIPSFVNIIPFNEWPGSPFKCSRADQIERFAEVFEKAGVAVNVRRSRGDDILAACGQLRGETSKFNSISLEFPSVVAQYGNEKQKAISSEKVKVEIK